jgi:hypothetical protein
LLFELDAPFNTENPFAGVFMGLDKGNKHSFVRPESAPSIQGGFDAFRRARPAFRPGRVIFFDVRAICCDQQPRLSPGGWELFVVVSEPNICQYEFFLRDTVGWLSIAGGEIVSVDGPSSTDTYCLGYISRLRDVEAIHYELPSQPVASGQCTGKVLKFTRPDGTL